MAVPTSDDANAIRGLILAQLAAFADDDAELAFSFASSGIRERFGTAEAFLDMVREYYASVHRARQALFGSLRGDRRHATQRVRLIDVGGRHAAAHYEVTRDKEGWRISGCVLTPIGVSSTD